MPNPSDQVLTTAREFAWKHFDLHAKQRIEVFKSYLVLLALIFAGYGVAFQSKNFVLGLLLSAFSMWIAALFKRWDKRNRDLIKVAEDYLKIDEAMLAAEGVAPEIKLFAKSDELSTHELSYTRILDGFYTANVFVGLVIFLFFVAFALVYVGPLYL